MLEIILTVKQLTNGHENKEKEFEEILIRKYIRKKCHKEVSEFMITKRTQLTQFIFYPNDKLKIKFNQSDRSCDIYEK